MKKGIVFALLTACVSGFSVFANSIFVSKTDPLVFAFVRNTVVALVIGIWVVMSQKERTLLFKLDRESWMKLFLIGAFGGGIPFGLFFVGLSEIGGVNGNIINKSLFLWVALFAVPLLGERLNLLQLLGYGTIFFATYIVGGTFTIVPKFGSMLVLIATILWAFEYVLVKKTLRFVSPPVVAFARMLFGLPFLMGIVAISGKTELLFDSGMYAFVPIVVSTAFLVLYMTSLYQALSRAPVTSVSAILVGAPIVTMILSASTGHKAVPLMQIVSSILVAGALFVFLLPALLTRIRRPYAN